MKPSPKIASLGEEEMSGTSLSATGLSQVEPVPVSPAVAASIPSADKLRQAQAHHDSMVVKEQAAVAQAVEQARAQWAPALTRARERIIAEAEKVRAITDSLEGWTVHDGGECPLPPDAMVEYRVRMEWEEMLSGGEPSLTEPPGGRMAESLRWTWESSWDDIIGYRVAASGIAAQSDETPAAAQPAGQEPGPKGGAR